MPSHCRTIETQIWGDERVIALTTEQKLVFMYSLTCDQSDWSGIYRMSVALAEEYLGLTKVKIRAALEALEVAGLIRWDELSSVIWVVNMWRKQVRTSPNSRQVEGVAKHLTMLPSSSNKRAFLEYYQGLGYFDGYPIDTLSIGSRDPLDRVDREKREERREKREDKQPTKSSAKRVANARTVCRWITEARRKLGIASRETEPTPTAVKQANKPLEAGHSLNDWRTVVDRATTSNRSDISAARKYLTLSTLHRPDNFARMLERDDLDGESKAGWWE